MLKYPISPWPAFTQEEADAVSRVLLSGRVNYWTGQEGRAFEAEFAAWCGTKHAVGVANGTVALDLALKGLEVGPGDEVIVSPRTFVASVSSVVNAGAVPVFADVNPDSGNLTVKTIEPQITPKTKAIIAVHLAGWPCDMDPIMALAERHDIKVIEDCAQAHGALYKGRSVGSIGHVGAWSFCQEKIMTTGGEGGMVTTSHQDLWSTMWSYKDHGKSWDAVYQRDHAPGFRWLHESFGTNFRITEMQSAIGRIQLSRMTDWSEARRQNSSILMAALKPFSGEAGPVRLPKLACDLSAGCRHAYYKLYAYIRPENLAEGWSRDRVVQEVNDLGVPCFQGSCSEVYLERAFDGTGWRPKRRLPVAKELGETSLMFLVHPTLIQAELERAGTAIHQVLTLAGR